jgi:hypothetical protein
MAVAQFNKRSDVRRAELLLYRQLNKWKKYIIITLVLCNEQSWLLGDKIVFILNKF